MRTLTNTVATLSVTVLVSACMAETQSEDIQDSSEEALRAACIETPLVSKYTANRPVVSSCPPGYVANGVLFSHRAGQNQTYQESFGLRCCPSPLASGPGSAADRMGSMVQKWALTVQQSAATDSAISGIAFQHPAGRNGTHEESYAVQSAAPIPLLSAASTCYETPWKRKWDLTIKPKCDSDTDYVRRVDLSHEMHQNLVHQESVRLECCSASLIGPGDPGEPGGEPGGGVITPIH